ncbi:MAG: hypothetical protein ACR2G5_10530 [Pyrinomonadaceae bacterium]
MRPKKYGVMLAVIFFTAVSGESHQPIFSQEQTSSPRKVLEYSKCSRGISGCINHEDEWARLDSAGGVLRNNIDSQAYVIAFAARDSLPGSGMRHANYVRNLLRRLVADDTRVRVIDGGRREHLTIEIWLAPIRSSSPVPNQSISSEATDNKSAYKFDEFYPSEYREQEALFSEYKYYDQSAVLDGFALLMEREPSLKGYIIAYDGQGDRAGTAYKFAVKYRQYLYDTNLLGTNPNVITSEPSRIIVLKGGRRKNRSIELWASPPGASAPRLISRASNTRNAQR